MGKVEGSNPFGATMKTLNFTINNEVTYAVFGDDDALKILQRLFPSSISSHITQDNGLSNHDTKTNSCIS